MLSVESLDQHTLMNHGVCLTNGLFSSHTHTHTYVGVITQHENMVLLVTAITATNLVLFHSHLMFVTGLLYFTAVLPLLVFKAIITISSIGHIY